MLRLIYKDIFIYQRRNFIILFGFGIYFPWLLSSSVDSNMSAIISLMSMFSVMMISQTAFSFDEAYKFNKFIKALPVSAEKIAISRYAACLGTAVIGAVWAVAVMLIINILPESVPIARFYVFPGLEGILTSAAIVITTISILIPILYKFGYLKLRFIMMLLLILVLSVMPLLFQLGNSAAAGFLKFLDENFIITFALSLILLIASVKLSASILRKKEY